MQPIDFLRRTPPFDTLDEDALQQIVQSLKVVRYPAEMRILQRGGEPSHYLYIVREGAVRLEQDGQTILLLEEGDLFGFPSLLAQDAPLFDVVVEEPALIYQIHETLFRQLLQHPPFADYFLQGLAERLRRTAEAQPRSALAFYDFTAPLSRIIGRPPVFVEPDVSVAQAAQVMHQHNISSVLVASDPVGILTVRDLRSRVLAQGRLPSTPVREVMTAPVHTIPAHATIYQALLQMMEQGVHHLPVEDHERIVGIVTDTDLLRKQMHNPLALFEQVRRVQKPEDLATYAQNVAVTVDWLFRNGLDVLEIGRVIASLNDALMARLLSLAEAELGPPPTPYAWFVFGSEGRMEQLLLTDQDNALAYAEASPEADAYFAQLAEWVVNALIGMGFPPCQGGYMATHWRRPLDEWERQFRAWVETPTPQALMAAGIFFDYRRVWGELPLSSLQEIILAGGRNHIFLAHMARASQAWQPPLGFFHRIRDEHGKVDLKRGGIAPIVALARVYALEAQSDARPTLDRLHAARRAGMLSQDSCETLCEAFRFLMRLRLRAQLNAVHQGQSPTNAIILNDLVPMEKHMLKEAFRAIRDVQAALGFRYQTDLLGS